jgi:DNA (cytosine-5)-methyltransferase 1
MVDVVANIPRYAEFFAGGGMVSAALRGLWTCALANDIDPKKCATYVANWGADGLVQCDVRDISAKALCQPIDLYWASSPCQDFSLAGKGLGLGGIRSGVFVAWANLVGKVAALGYKPRIIAFENVAGLVSRNGGKDFESILLILIRLGYQVGAMEIDAIDFLPHSRPRIFVVAVRDDIEVPKDLTSRHPCADQFHTRRLRSFQDTASSEVKKNWIWWKLPKIEVNEEPVERMLDQLSQHKWFTEIEVSYLLSLMTDLHLDKVDQQRKTGESKVGFVYKRGRPDETGRVRQYAEVRFDGIAGCIRTPAGGSSRQTLLFIKGNETRARLMSPREAVRLMGLADDYILPQSFNEGYRLAGDGVAVPVVSFLDAHLFQPLLGAAIRRQVA